MATLRETNDGGIVMSLRWKSDRFKKQEEILSQYTKPGDLREFIMEAILIAHVAKQNGMIPPSFVASRPDTNEQTPPPPRSAKAAASLKKFDL